MRLSGLEVYNSIFNITEENNMLEIYTDIFDELPFTELIDELEEILSLSDIKPAHLQHGLIAPPIFQTY